MAANAPISGEDLADVLEATITLSGKPSLATEELRRLAESTFYVATTNLPFALQQMHWRSTVLGSAYPFRVMPASVSRETTDGAVNYDSLLLLSPSVASRLTRRPADSALFERLTALAIQELLGRDSRAVRFAWPSDEGRPQEFAQAVIWLAEQMKIRVGSGYRPPRRKDGGVDIVAWRPFRDNRPGFPVTLVQCTLEPNFVHKARDIEVRLWSTWLGLDSEPMCVLAIPGTVGRNEDWNEVALSCVLLERLRLTSLLAARQHPPLREAVEFVDAVRQRVLVEA